ncbi:MAG: OmpA family protein [Brumimicrobium sp.]
MKLGLFISILHFLFSINTKAQEIEVLFYFNYDSDTLTNDTKARLDSLIPNLSDSKVTITGATDTIGNKKYNDALAFKRAQNVKDYLVQNGINKEEISNVSSVGETNRFTTIKKNRNVLLIYTQNNKTDENTIQKQINVDKHIEKKSEKVKNRAEESEIENKVKKDEEDHLSRTRDVDITQKTFHQAEVGDILNISGLEFVPGRKDLLKSSKPTIKKLAKILKKNPSIKIEIQGHICCQNYGDGIDNDTGENNLSYTRAKKVYKLLRWKGVNKDQLSFKGYGSSRKLVEETNEASRQRNRRVSILIVEK